MHVSTKGRYAVTAMIDVAMRAARGPVALVAVSRRQQISLSYLEQLFGMLRRSELVQSTRGPGGGYTLNRDPLDISVGDIIAAVDRAGDQGAGDRYAAARAKAGRGLSLDLWSGLDARMRDYLASVSLDALVQHQLARGVSAGAAPAPRAMTLTPPARPPKATGPNSVFALGAYLAATTAERGTPRPGTGRKPYAGFGVRRPR